jgi:P-loop containing NTP hydrolase pore-1
VFDEGHAAKNLRPGKAGSSMTGQKVFALQEQLPKARVVYVSATGATEPHRTSSLPPVSYFIFLFPLT